MSTTPTLAIPPAPTSEPTIIPPPGRPWTEEDLMALDSDDRYQYELVRGELRQMSPASFKHGKLEALLIYAVMVYLKTNPLGDVVTGDTGFKLQTDPLTIRVPDVAFVAAERIPTETMPAFLALAPDLVVEIVSPSETARSIAEKVSDYLQAGTQLLWLVYPEQQEVQEYRLGQPFQIYRIDDELDGREVLPGFRFALRDLFA